MTILSQTLIANQSHPDNINLETVVGDKFPGDGYYGRDDGIHTVQYQVENFTGSLVIQASLSVDPQETDWFDVLTEEMENQSHSKIQNFTGNYVWVRARIVYQKGSLTSVSYNH